MRVWLDKITFYNLLCENTTSFTSHILCCIYEIMVSFFIFIYIVLGFHQFIYFEKHFSLVILLLENCLSYFNWHKESKPNLHLKPSPFGWHLMSTNHRAFYTYAIQLKSSIVLPKIFALILIVYIVPPNNVLTLYIQPRYW